MTVISFVDCETLGLDPDLHAIWEVALITYDAARRRRTDEYVWQLAISVEQLEAGDPVGMEIGGFHERYERSWSVDPATFAREFADLTADTHLCGNVISFDEERLRRLLKAHGVAHRWHYHLIDIEPMIVGYLAGKYGDDLASGPPPPTLPWNSKVLSRAIGVDPADFAQHEALADARWAMAEYRAIHG